MDCYAKTCQRLLLAPDGQRTWPETCTYLGMDMDCYVTFPNSQQTAHYRWSVIWSADGQFLAVPEGGSHDTPPAGYEIWNMAEGVKTSRIAYNGILQRWSPTGHTVAYVKRLTSGDQEFWLMDAATGAGQPTRQCPSWATDPLKISDYFDWRQVCDIWVPPAGQPVILSFTVAPSEASPGDNVTVTWASANATSARLRTYASNSTDAPEMAVPPSGSLVVTISKDDRFAYMFYLTVTDDAGQADQRLRSVSLLCPAAFFFTTSTRPITGGCPYKPPAFVAAAQQTFEHGQMLWLAPLPPASTATGYGPGATVYILYNAGVMEAWATWQTYDDVWTPALPESDPALEPPAGLYQPLRGFGKIWRETPGLRDKLGWATALEQGFNGAYQVQWRLGQLPGDVYLRAAGGSILYLQSDGNWWYRM
jgi:hypothetical protein